MVFMSEGKESRLSAGQRADVWRRWKAGESLHEIGRACGKPHNCIRCVLLPRGGIAPTARRRSESSPKPHQASNWTLLIPKGYLILVTVVAVLVEYRAYSNLRQRNGTGFGLHLWPYWQMLFIAMPLFLVLRFGSSWRKYLEQEG